LARTPNASARAVGGDVTAVVDSSGIFRLAQFLQ